MHAHLVRCEFMCLRLLDNRCNENTTSWICPPGYYTLCTSYMHFLRNCVQLLFHRLSSRIIYLEYSTELFYTCFSIQTGFLFVRRKSIYTVTVWETPNLPCRSRHFIFSLSALQCVPRREDGHQINDIIIKSNHLSVL